MKRKRKTQQKQKPTQRQVSLKLSLGVCRLFLLLQLLQQFASLTSWQIVGDKQIEAEEDLEAQGFASSLQVVPIASSNFEAAFQGKLPV